MFLDEARLAGRIQHPNAVSTLDVVATKGELFLVMEYVHGDALSHLLKWQRAHGKVMDPSLAASIVCGALHGLHAAHEARDERGSPLGIVHRDVSPHNILVGIDGIARVLDFGVAKAVGRIQTTRDGQLEGKLAYMAPEQLRGDIVDRRVDVYAAAVVLWEALAGHPLFQGDNEGVMVTRVLAGATEPPSRYHSDISDELDTVVMRGLAPHLADRFDIAREFAVALEEAVGLASPRKVGEWVEGIAGGTLSSRARLIEDIETATAVPSELGGIGPEVILGETPSMDPPVPQSAAGEGTSRAAGGDTAVTVASAAPPLSRSSSQLSSITVTRSRPASGASKSRATPIMMALGALALLGIGGLFAALTLGGGSPGSHDEAADEVALQTTSEAAAVASTSPAAEPDDATAEAGLVGQCVDRHPHAAAA
jgi:serine/threonine-protein kinase